MFKYIFLDINEREKKEDKNYYVNQRLICNRENIKQAMTPSLYGVYSQYERVCIRL